MVQINEAMLRGRAEHNDRCLSNLKEISLHQQNIEGINRMLTRMCPELEILYLQHNLIPKIENLKRLRDLDYLNLALNNIKKIEGLDRNEKLRKLDLTVNFIDIENLLSVESLRVNHNLRELFLIGNPCTEFQSYRLYVIGTLPQLEKLDGHAITATERIQAEQQLRDIRVRLVAAARERVKQMGGDPNLVDAEQVPDQEIDSDEEGKELYGFSPEIRLADYKREVKKKQREDEEKKTMEREKDPMKAAKEDYYKNRSLMKEDGTPRVCNDGKWNFDINDDKEGNIVVRIEFPKFMDSSMLDLDVQPTFFRVTCRKPEKHDKIIQLLLPEEVRADAATAQRSQITGELKIICPKLHWTRSAKQEDKAVTLQASEAPRNRRMANELQGSVDIKKCEAVIVFLPL
mmetsp:Transcript_42699/g.134536  ORF Transcript_42699/g.134536 Transcript_42699/m.134536 type:complete len:403 (-) Transcript_42699:868-2076(-)